MTRPGHKEPNNDFKAPPIPPPAPEGQLSFGEDLITDPLDSHAHTTPGQIALKESGMTPRQANNLLTAKAVLHVLSQGINERAAARAAAEARRDKERTAQTQELLRNPIADPTDKTK